MAVTRNQVNAGKAAILDEVFKLFPECRRPAIRAAIKLARGGNATTMEVRNAIINEAWQFIFGGGSPVGNHAFRHWLNDAVCVSDSRDPLSDVNESDVFDAQAATVS